jgi:hypothetical protein
MLLFDSVEMAVKPRFSPSTPLDEAVVLIFAVAPQVVTISISQCETKAKLALRTQDSMAAAGWQY